jgi:hypothetical protein
MEREQNAHASIRSRTPPDAGIMDATGTTCADIDFQAHKEAVSVRACLRKTRRARRGYEENVARRFHGQFRSCCEVITIANRCEQCSPEAKLLPMFLPKINVKHDPIRRWHRPDRHFFANGACQELAFAFLERYPDLGFHARRIKPAAGYTGKQYLRHRRNQRVRRSWFDDGAAPAVSGVASDFFQAGTQRWWICRPTFSFQNSALAKSKDFGCENQRIFL